MMNIKDKFLELTSRTYPHGTEQDLFGLLGSNLQKDEFDNLFIKIGESDVMFTSHLDTATSALTDVKHVFEKNIIKTDGKSILGADDKAGVTIMLYMIENNIPGLYYFFLGEEVGCVGSRKLATKLKTDKIEGINKVISFDRRGNDSVITYQSSQRCCSDKFGEALSEALNKADETFSYKNDPTGVLTDSIQFISIYPECTNISVGYKSEHTFSEQQDIEHLTKLANACLLVNWSELPVERDPSKTEYRSYGYGYGYGYGYDMYDEWGDSDWGQYPAKNKVYNSDLEKNKKFDIDIKPRTEPVWFWDEKYQHISNVTVESFSRKVVSVDLSKERIEYEKVLIDDLLTALDLDYSRCEWDGLFLKVYYIQDNITVTHRNDVLEYLPELDYSKLDELGGALSTAPEDFPDFVS